jgi:membrane-bound lytic murein transglycosylase A
MPLRMLPLAALLLLAGCAPLPQSVERPEPACAAPAAAPACPACPACPAPTPTEPAKPAAKPLQPASWDDLPGWRQDDPRPAFAAFREGCATLARQARWQALCERASDAPAASADALRAWMETNFRPWALTNADGSQSGLITGYYEPVLRGSRRRHGSYQHPVFPPPDDLIDVELGSLYPELKHMRLRGRLDGRRLVPYFSRGEWTGESDRRADSALLWIDDPLDLFFMEIQGAGQVALDDGTRTRVGYADQNGHPFRSVARWLIQQGEMTIDEASMQGIRKWARTHPERLRELLDANPSLVFFRELPVEGAGPPGALGIPLVPERTMAVDPRHITLGTPIFLATTQPNSRQPLNRLVLAADTGGAIRGIVRGDFFWGTGKEAGREAGRMRQQGRMWLLLPADAPD